MSNALEVDNLTIRLGTTELLCNLTFQVRQGTSLAIIGPNDSGKTVLLKALIGALPYSGTIRWAPNTVVGCVPQKLDIERDLPLSGRDFLRAKAALSEASLEEIRGGPAHRRLLSDQGVAQPIGTLSGGQFQRRLVAFTRQGPLVRSQYRPPIINNLQIPRSACTEKIRKKQSCLCVDVRGRASSLQGVV